MHNKKLGYVAVQFTTETNQKIMKWSLALEDKDLITATINGKTKGGLVTNKLHLTLLYGLDDEILNINELSEFLKKIRLEEIKVKGIGLLPIKEHNCNILYLKIEDSNDELGSIHKSLKKFPHSKNHQEVKYIPHVSIAYVKKDFNLDVFTQKPPKILHVHDIQYFTSQTYK